jgi:Post-segregation antitoxin CcdA
VTHNPSGVIESLLADFLAAEKQRRAVEAQMVRATIETWNHFTEKCGSFVDEHSTL